MRTLVLCCVFAAAATRNVSGIQEPARRVELAIDSALSLSPPAAQRALQTFRKLVDSQTYAGMGFDAVGDVRSATLGDALVVFHVGRDSLRKYQVGVDPFTLLRGGNRILYPVLVRRETRSSITLANDGSGWKGVAYGGPVTAKRAWAVLSDTTRRPRPSSRQYFLVQILALNMNFLGVKQNSNLGVIPLFNDQRRKLQAGVLRPAAEVFASLAEEARHVEDSLPR